jgi:lysophospholipase L1-like esterase
MKKVYIIGDSISLHYGEYFADAISDSFVCVQRENVQEALDNINMAVGGNGGDSSRVLSLVKKQEEEGSLDAIDVLIFNCGLHDIKRHPPKGALQVEADLYERNLCEIVEIIKKHGISPIFLTTTPVNDEIHHSYLEINNGIERFGEDVINYNKIAVNVMEKYNVPIIDLYGYTLPFGEKAYDDHVHYTAEVRRLQAEFIANELKRIIL